MVFIKGFAYIQIDRIRENQLPIEDGVPSVVGDFKPEVIYALSEKVVLNAEFVSIR